MSSLNIDDLYENKNSKHLRRLEQFDGILKKVHMRIKASKKKKKMHCFYQIPEFIIGVPLYNVNELKQYIMNSLKKNGFNLLYVDPNWLFISWEEKKKNKVLKPPSKKKEVDYKLIDEYKPLGGFIYSENDLSSLKQ